MKEKAWMKAYRKKPVEVEAMQLLSDDDLNDALEWIGRSVAYVGISEDEDDVTCLYIRTPEGTMQARWDKGDYIIKGVQGEFYPCKRDIFEATYEEA